MLGHDLQGCLGGVHRESIVSAQARPPAARSWEAMHRKARRHAQSPSPDMYGGQGYEATARRALTDKKPMTDLPE
jgi:hypothetical protein